PSAPPLSSASPSCPSPASTNATCLARPDSSRFVPRDSSLQLGGVKRNFLYCPKRNFSLCRDRSQGPFAIDFDLLYDVDASHGTLRIPWRLMESQKSDSKVDSRVGKRLILLEIFRK